MRSRRTSLSATTLLVLAIPILVGLIRTPKILAESSQKVGAPFFTATSVQSSPAGRAGTTVRFAPGRLTLANWTTKDLITYAYDTTHIVGGPSWTDTERYIINVKVDDSRAYESGKLVGFNSPQGSFPPGLRHRELMFMLQSVLADRFGVKLSHETKELPVYALVVAKNGLKLPEATPSDTYDNGIVGIDGLPTGPHTGSGGNGHLTVQALPISTVAETLSQQLGRTVVDRTGLTGDYNFTLDWTQESSASSISAAIEQQLGLNLELQEIPTDFLVIEQAKEPQGN